MGSNPKENLTMEVQGRIKEIFETKTYGSNGFRKRQLVITTEEQYPQHLLIDFLQDKVEILDKFKKDQLVKVSIDLRGREWTSPQGEVKYFNSLNGWRVEAAQAADGAVPPPDEFEPAPNAGFEQDDEEDDLPF